MDLPTALTLAAAALSDAARLYSGSENPDHALNATRARQARDLLLSHRDHSAKSAPGTSGPRAASLGAVNHTNPS